MQNLYDRTENALRQQSAFLSLNADETEDDAYMAIRSVMRDHPDIFWFSHQWKYYPEQHGMRLNYTLTPERVAEAKVQIDDVVTNDFCVALVQSLPVREQLMYVYKWLGKYCHYNIYSAFNQSILSVFVYRNSVCTGFAKAAQYLLRLLGIESKLVFGQMKGSEADSRHCWLVVKVDGEWYHLDPTFAVPDIQDLLLNAGVQPLIGDDGLAYNFFCTDTATIAASRTIEEAETLPTCLHVMDLEGLKNLEVKTHREDGDQKATLGCLLSSRGTTADIYLLHDDDAAGARQQWVVKTFKKDTDKAVGIHEMKVGARAFGPHLLQCVRDIRLKGSLKVEQATPLADLLCCHYYQLTASRFCGLLMDVLCALKECLNCGFYYRDIHLNNIYRSNDGTYKLGDFGSCIGVMGERFDGGGVGSPWYLPPETLRYHAFDETSLVYGVGMIAYYLLNDLYPPFWKEKGHEANTERLSGKTVPVPSVLREMNNELSRHLAFIIDKALAIEQRRRYQHLEELQTDLYKAARLTRQDDVLLVGAGCARRIEVMQETFVENKGKSTPSPSFETTAGHEAAIVELDRDLENDDVVIDIDNDLILDNPAIVVDNDGCVLDDDFSTTSFGVNYCNDIDSLPTMDSCPSESAVPPASPAPPSLARPVSDRINDFASTAAPPELSPVDTSTTYYPTAHRHEKSSRSSFWKRLFGSRKAHIEDSVISSVFAPAQVKERSHMLVQVFLHLEEETDRIVKKAIEADENARRRGYAALQCKLKKGDQVTVELKVIGDRLLLHERKMLVWQGSVTKCSFDYFVPQDLDALDLSCEVALYIQGVPLGDMCFVTTIVENPRKLNADVKTRQYNKIFISYSHKDAASVKGFAHALKAQGSDYFYDRDTLMAGDVYEEKIFSFIDTADLFILCWSKNAAESEYVGKERHRAMQHAYPFQSLCDATLKIYPISIEPRAELPADMRDVYSFEEI